MEVHYNFKYCSVQVAIIMESLMAIDSLDGFCQLPHQGLVSNAEINLS